MFSVIIMLIKIELFGISHRQSLYKIQIWICHDPAKEKESQCKKKKGKNYDRKFENIYKHFHLRMQEAKSLKKICDTCKPSWKFQNNFALIQAKSFKDNGNISQLYSVFSLLFVSVEREVSFF